MSSLQKSTSLENPSFFHLLWCSICEPGIRQLVPWAPASTWWASWVKQIHFLPTPAESRRRRTVSQRKASWQPDQAVTHQRHPCFQSWQKKRKSSLRLSPCREQSWSAGGSPPGSISESACLIAWRCRPWIPSRRSGSHKDQCCLCCYCWTYEKKEPWV